MARHRIRKKPMSQINVVPYIDVSLVLLLIFMITTPLLTQGVKVDLPRATAKPLPTSQIKPLVVSVKRDGTLYLNVGEHPSQPLEEQVLMARVAAVLRNRPATKVVVKGDKDVPYGRVVRAMTLLQAAGAPTVGLMTRQPERSAK
ncbi:MAG: protein TolR [Gammaproteobacteria bacterium]|jgi:biopolymer transport protein TolR